MTNKLDVISIIENWWRWCDTVGYVERLTLTWQCHKTLFHSQSVVMPCASTLRSLHHCSRVDSCAFAQLVNFVCKIWLVTFLASQLWTSVNDYLAHTKLSELSRAVCFTTNGSILASNSLMMQWECRQYMILYWYYVPPTFLTNALHIIMKTLYCFWVAMGQKIETAEFPPFSL